MLICFCNTFNLITFYFFLVLIKMCFSSSYVEEAKTKQSIWPKENVNKWWSVSIAAYLFNSQFLHKSKACYFLFLAYIAIACWDSASSDTRSTNFPQIVLYCSWDGCKYCKPHSSIYDFFKLWCTGYYVRTVFKFLFLLLCNKLPTFVCLLSLIPAIRLVHSEYAESVLGRLYIWQPFGWYGVWLALHVWG